MNRLCKSFLSTLFVFSLCLASASAADHKVLACVGGKVYPSPAAAPIDDAAVLIEDGKITAVAADAAFRPGSAEVLDCKGKVIVAGFWNSHVHFETGWHGAADAPADKLESHMQEMLTQWGFTTVWDLGSEPRNTLVYCL